MTNETMRIFFPLKIITYPQGEYGMDDNPMEITPAEAVAYEDAILAAIAVFCSENSSVLQKFFPRHQWGIVYVNHPSPPSY